jgi:hypothetical protein
VLVDARNGIALQTRRHLSIASMMGIRHVMLAVNKMDLVGYDHAVFAGITDAFAGLAMSLGIERPVAIPVSGLLGDNVCRRSTAMPWYEGPTLIEALESAKPRALVPEAFRMPVQYVIRADGDFRGFCRRELIEKRQHHEGIGLEARTLGVGRGLLVGRRFGQRFLGPHDGAGIVAGSKCEPAYLLEQLSALDRIAILAEPFETRRETGAGALAIAGLPVQSTDFPAQPRGAGAIGSRLKPLPHGVIVCKSLRPSPGQRQRAHRLGLGASRRCRPLRPVKLRPWGRGAALTDQ